MTHKLTIKDKEYLLVEISKETIYNLGISICKKVIGDTNNSANWKKFAIQLPIENNYRIINTISNLTEEECKSLVECISDSYPVYRNYLLDSQYFEYLPKTAKESFISLLKSKNILSKSFVDEPIHIFSDSPIKEESKMYMNKLEEYQNLADELLLIEITK
jgi:hypothetical protein